MLATIGVKYYRCDQPRCAPAATNTAVDVRSWHFSDVSGQADDVGRSRMPISRAREIVAEAIASNSDLTTDYVENHEFYRIVFSIVFSQKESPV